MKRIVKIEDNSLLVPLAGIIISLLQGVLLLYMDQHNRIYVIPCVTVCNLVIFIITFNMIRKRFRLALTAADALDNKALDAEKFKELGGFAGELVKKLRLIGNKITEATTLITRIGEEQVLAAPDYLLEKDEIRIALVEIHEKITSYNDQEKKRKWVVEGVAKFSSILRQNNKELSEVGIDIISNLVRYVGGNQGGFFVAGENEQQGPYLELIASYAYDGRKFLEKIVYSGQGLLGQSMREKGTIYMTKIPDQYVSITSGLGQATPGNLVIIPLLLNEEYCGAIELASFTILEDYQLEFLEKVAENIASYVSSVKISSHTQKLLLDSQALTSELKQREEEMRQNLEELTAAHEDMEKKQIELDGIFNAIDTTMGIAGFDMNGRILEADENLLEIFGYTSEDVLGQYHDMLLGRETDNERIWEDLRKNISSSGDFCTRSKSGDEVWINASFTKVKDKENNFDKVLMLAKNITERKQTEREFERLSLVADNTDNSVIITDSQGYIEYVNKGFCRLTGYAPEEIIGKKPGTFLQGPDTDPETVKRLSRQIKKGEPIYEEILNYDKNGKSYWISLAINPVYNDQGKIQKFISVQANITETKTQALDYHYKLEAIGKANVMVELSPEGIVLDANATFLKMFGYQKEEVIGKHHRIYTYPEFHNSKAYEVLWERLRKGEFISDEFRRRHKSGTEIWLRGVYSPIFDVKNKLIKIVKFAVDITREKRLQIETQEQDALLKNQLDTINKTLASVEYDVEGNITDANQIFLGVTGYQKKEIMNKPYTFLLSEAELEKPQTQIMWQNLREGQFFTGEFKQVDKSGKDLWLLGTYNPILDQAGKPTKIVMFAQFTTREKERQLELKGTTDALKKSLPVMELNGDGTFKNANEIFFKRFGYKRLELRNAKFDLFLNGDAKKVNAKGIFRRLKEDQFVEEKLKLTDKMGKYRQFKTTFYPIKNLENKISKIVVILIGEN